MLRLLCLALNVRVLFYCIEVLLATATSGVIVIVAVTTIVFDITAADVVDVVVAFSIAVVAASYSL